MVSNEEFSKAESGISNDNLELKIKEIENLLNNLSNKLFAEDNVKLIQNLGYKNKEVFIPKLKEEMQILLKKEIECK